MERNEFWLQSAAALACGSTGDKATLPVPGGQFDIVWFEVTFEGASAHATVPVIALDHRVTAGTDTGRVSNVCTITKTAVNAQGKLYYEKPASLTTVDGGDELVVEVTTANGEALAFSARVKLRERPEAIANLTNAVLSA